MQHSAMLIFSMFNFLNHPLVMPPIWPFTTGSKKMGKHHVTDNLASPTLLLLNIITLSSVKLLLSITTSTLGTMHQGVINSHTYVL